MTVVDKLAAYSGNALHELSDFLHYLHLIAQVAEKEEENAKKELGKIRQVEGINELSAAALESMRTLYDYVQAMEVCDASD